MSEAGLGQINYASVYPRLNAMRDLLQTKYRFSRDIIDRGLKTFGSAWAMEFEALLQAMFDSPEALAAATKGYSSFAMDSLRLQAQFEKELVYKNKTYAEAASQVYFNEAYMMAEYLPGLLLSHYLWPHHYRQLEFFDTAFVRPMRVAGCNSFVEVGIGTGLYSRLLLQSSPDVTGLGLDISEWSQAATERHVAAFGLADRYHVELRDVVAQTPENAAERLVCVEVLEHLENPPEFLAALRRLLAPGGRAFITAAVNAASPDHIYLYRSAAEVEEHLTQAGFAIEQSFVASAYKPPTAGVPVPLAVAFVAY